jgi:hypothetical protein
MEFKVHSFGSDYETELRSEHKGIGSFFDSFLNSRVKGEAGFYHHIVKTPTDEIIKQLNARGVDNEINRILEWYDFHTLFLSMSIKMNDPSRWILYWGRFIFDIHGKDISVVSFAPNLEGIRTEVQKNESREINFSLSSEIGSVASNMTNLTGGSTVSPRVLFDKNRGWTLKFETTIEELRGFVTKTKNGVISLQWDIYKNQSSQVPGTNLGATVVVYSTALIAKSRDSKATIKAQFLGEASPISTSIRRRGSIELTTITDFALEPSLDKSMSESKMSNQLEL